jgi:hypothetical protein
MKKGTSLKGKLVAALLSLAISHLSLAIVFAAPQISGKLITSGGLPVTVNGNSAQSGATILSGAVIEAPDNVVATIQVGDLGELELQPGSIAVIEFDGKNIKVTLRRGCARLTTNKGTSGSVVDYQGRVFTSNSDAEEGVSGDPDYRRVPNSAAQSDGTKRRAMPVCGVIPPGGTFATASLTAAVAPPTTAAAAGGGLGGAAIAAIIGGIGAGAIIGGIVGFGGDASPNSPR